MFGFSTLKRWILGDRNRDLMVFHYHDGNRVRSADPIQIETTLINMMGKDWRAKLEKVAKPIPAGLIGDELEQVEEERRLLDEEIMRAVDVAFDVQPYRDGVGMTVLKRRGLLTGYMNYCRDLIAMSRPFVKQQSRASPGIDNQRPVSMSVST